MFPIFNVFWQFLIFGKIQDGAQYGGHLEWRQRPPSSAATHNMSSRGTHHSLSTKGEILSKYCNITKIQGGFHQPPPPPCTTEGVWLCLYVRGLSPNIIQMLLTGLHRFYRLLIGRTCLYIKTVHVWWLFATFSWPACVIILTLVRWGETSNPSPNSKIWKNASAFRTKWPKSLPYFRSIWLHNDYIEALTCHLFSFSWQGKSRFIRW